MQNIHCWRRPGLETDLRQSLVRRTEVNRRRHQRRPEVTEVNRRRHPRRPDDPRISQMAGPPYPGPPPRNPRLPLDKTIIYPWILILYPTSAFSWSLLINFLLQITISCPSTFKTSYHTYTLPHSCCALGNSAQTIREELIGGGGGYNKDDIFWVLR